MGAKSTIKSRERTGSQPGFHLYVDQLDDFGGLIEEDELPVYLRLDGVSLSVEVTQPQAASVTVLLPRETARALGLVQSHVAGADDTSGAVS